MLGAMKNVFVPLPHLTCISKVTDLLNISHTRARCWVMSILLILTACACAINRYIAFTFWVAVKSRERCSVNQLNHRAHVYPQTRAPMTAKQ